MESRQEFANWIKARLVRLKEHRDFLVDKVINGDSKGLTATNTLGLPIEYYLTLDAAKGIAALENNVKGDEIRQYFIDAENRLAALKAGAVAPTTLLGPAGGGE